MTSDHVPSVSQPVTSLRDAEMDPEKSSSAGGDASPEKPLLSDASTLPAPPAKQEEDLVTQVMRFLSTATPGTLGAVAVGLSAVTYFILGRIGLVLIGAFSGIVLFASWESRHPEVSRAVRGEKGYDFLERLFDARSAARTQEPDESDAQALVQSFEDFQPETRDALHSLVDAVIRDYVDYWYSPLVPTDRSFPLSCRKVLTNFLLTVSNQLSRKRPADAFVDFLTHTCSIVIVFFSEMTSAYASLPSADSNTVAADAIYNYLASNHDSPLSNLLNQKQQNGKFKMVAEDLLSFLDRPTYDCDPARAFLREILSTIVLEGTLQTCSKAEWINGWIVYLFESGDTDLSQAIDEAMQDQKAFSDVDGNFGGINLAKGNRSSTDINQARRKEGSHQKTLSKADEEMERAMEEMKRLNAMIAEADKVKQPSAEEKATEAAALLDGALKENAKELDLNVDQQVRESTESVAQQPPVGEAVSPRAQSVSGKTSQQSEQAQSPPTPKSTVGPASPDSSPQGQDSSANHRFTSFDQIVQSNQYESDDDSPRRPQPLTLHNASISVIDEPGTNRLRTKPVWEYLLQVEPASMQQPGWMSMKTYTQFEALHESLRRIAAISGAMAFMEAFATFPSWKIHTRSSLRGEIERYMRAACAEKSLAESESMKKFLEKDQDARLPVSRGFSFESVGKGVLGALQNAPKGAFDGGRSVVGGVTGVFGNIGLGQRKSMISSARESPVAKPTAAASSRPFSLSALTRSDSTPAMKSRESLDSQRSSVISTQPGKVAPMERRPSYPVDPEHDNLQPTSPERGDRNSRSAASSRGNSRPPSMTAMRSPSELSLSNMKLPPPPDEISDDYDSMADTRPSSDTNPRTNEAPMSPFTAISSPTRSSSSQRQDKPAQPNGSGEKPRKQHAPLSEQETRVTVELLFAVINELYTLSSAWNIRRTLLTAAKSYLIRPGNPSLVSIQSLIQDTVLEANTSDAGIAAHLKKIRENSLPTEEERKAWPAEMTAEEKEELRVKARKLFIQSSIPAALMGIMGQNATSEALGRLFDCLQIEEVSRGLFFGIMLQAVRVVTH